MVPGAVRTPPPVLVLARDAPAYLAELDALELRAHTTVAEAREAYAGEPVLLADPPLAAAALPHMPEVRWVQSTWAGLGPLLPAAHSGITVTGVKGVFGAAMAEYCLAHMLAHTQQLHARASAAAARRWDRRPPLPLRGKRAGILGTGSIGAHLGRVLAQLGMEVVGCSRSGRAQPPFTQVHTPATFSAFASELDFLLAALPHTPHTAGLLDEAALASLPPRCYLINVGRGSLLDERALCEALQAGRLAGAALDVFALEPLPHAHAFWTTPRLTITAHIAALSEPREIAALFSANYRRYCAGHPLAHRLDPERGY